MRAMPANLSRPSCLVRRKRRSIYRLVEPRRYWNEALVIEELACPGGPDAASAGKELIAWIGAKADRAVFNDAPNVGSAGPEFVVGDEPCLPMRFLTDGSAHQLPPRCARRRRRAKRCGQAERHPAPGDPQRNDR